MTVRMPSAQSPIVTRSGAPTSEWAPFFMRVARLLSGGAPFPLAAYTVATLPDAAAFKDHMIIVSDESGGSIPAFSDGTNWRRSTDRAIVT